MLARVFDRAQGVAVLGVMNFDPAIHIRQFDMCAPVAQFSAQIVPDELMMIYTQPEIIINAARKSTRFDLGIGIRRNRQIQRPVH